ncbi:ROK family transcriptional regulator [Kribbella qitaiheensis]|uniref:ROK family transcriptional regulator n=1 Tax=Kribbella qitaiheensis TaxID=1544730 RepID=A0A7G6X4U6_9ACTN|nr:ROK family transcriptional regulator [Kribbella qitaiheensis]QNE21261.1 ROK family transcriptional regulator [Kribbella qitaiheensis]
MQPVRVGSKELIREINSSLVLGELRGGLVSRTELAKRTGLSLPTVSEIVGEMLASGVIEERETASSGGGRRPVLLGLKADAGYVIGIKLTETKVIAVLTDLNAGIVERATAAVTTNDVGTVVRTVAKVVRTLTGKRSVYGVGVGVAGVIDRATGVVRHGTYSDWHDVDLAALLEKKLGLPVVVDNDVNTLVASEQWFGAGRGVSDVAVVSIGRGIGLGMVLDGRLYRGAGGGAGEFGHTKVVADGPLCACGGNGCLEALIGEPAICAQAGTKTIEQAIDKARQGDKATTEIFEQVGRILGTAVGNLVNLLNPKLIVLAGEGTRAGDLFGPSFDEALRETVFDGLQRDLEVVVDDWDDEAWAQGAAGLFLGELFQPNLRPDEAGRPSLTARSAS